jgi:hypothetical protein
MVLRGLEASSTMRSEGWSIGKSDLSSKVCLRLVRTPVTLLKSRIVSESMVNERMEGLFDGFGIVLPSRCSAKDTWRSGHRAAPAHLSASSLRLVELTVVVRALSVRRIRTLAVPDGHTRIAPEDGI